MRQRQDPQDLEILSIFFVWEQIFNFKPWLVMSSSLRSLRVWTASGQAAASVNADSIFGALRSSGGFQRPRGGRSFSRKRPGVLTVCPKRGVDRRWMWVLDPSWLNRILWRQDTGRSSGKERTLWLDRRWNSKGKVWELFVVIGVLYVFKLKLHVYRNMTCISRSSVLTMVVYIHTCTDLYEFTWQGPAVLPTIECWQIPLFKSCSNNFVQQLAQDGVGNRMARTRVSSVLWNCGCNE